MTKTAARAHTNAQIARQLTLIARDLRAKNENPFKVRAYYRAAELVARQPSSIAEQVRANTDLTRYTGIGPSIAQTLREIVLAGERGQLELPLAPAASGRREAEESAPRRPRRASSRRQSSGR